MRTTIFSALLISASVAIAQNKYTGNFTGAFFGNGGAITNLQVPSASVTNAPWVTNKTYWFPTNQTRVIFWGDSLTAGVVAENNGANHEAPASDVFQNDFRWLQVSNFSYPGMGSQIILTNWFYHSNMWDSFHVIWSGNNNATDTNQVLADIHTMRTNCAPSKTIICGMVWNDIRTNGHPDHATITQLNYYLSQIYPDQYVDIWTNLWDAVAATGVFDYRLPLASQTNSVAKQNWTNGILPKMFRSPALDDTIHLNDAGYAVVARAVEGKMRDYIYGIPVLLSKNLGKQSTLSATNIYADSLYASHAELDGNFSGQVYGAAELESLALQSAPGAYDGGTLLGSGGNLYIQDGFFSSNRVSITATGAVFSVPLMGDGSRLTGINAAYATNAGGGWFTNYALTFPQRGEYAPASISVDEFGHITIDSQTGVFFPGAGVQAGVFYGNGVGLTNLNASAISSGQIPIGAFAPVTISNTAGAMYAGDGTNRWRTYNGAAITNLQWSALPSPVPMGYVATNQNPQGGVYSQTGTNRNVASGVTIIGDTNLTVSGNFTNGSALRALNGASPSVTLSSNVTITGTITAPGLTILASGNATMQGVTATALSSSSVNASSSSDFGAFNFGRSDYTNSGVWFKASGGTTNLHPRLSINAHGMVGIGMTNATSFLQVRQSAATYLGGGAIPSIFSVQSSGLSNLMVVAADGNTSIANTLTTSNVVATALPGNPASQGVSFGSDGTNALLIFRNSAGAFTTNKISLGSYP